MATVTRLKAEVFNKNLPILTNTGEVTNYYVGSFINKLVEKEYSITSVEKNAVNAFINSAIDNGYIDYIQYLLPFIGDSDHPEAGVVPLIDNVDEYRMAEYTGLEPFADLFEYNQSGKIISVHNSVNIDGDIIKTPVTYRGQGNGIGIFFNANYEAAVNINFIVLSETVLDGGVNKYLRMRYDATSTENTIKLLTTSSTAYPVTRFRNNSAEIIANDYNVNVGYAYHRKEDGCYGWNLVAFNNNYLEVKYGKSQTAIWDDLDYKKYSVGRNLSEMYLKTFVFIDVNIPDNLKSVLSRDVFNLVNALGRV